MFEAKFIYFLLTSDDLNFRIDRPQRMIIFEILNLFTQLETKLDPTSNYSNIYIEWKKRLIQGCVKFEQVFTQIRDLFLTVNILGHLQRNIHMYKVLFYTTDESFRICLERKRQPHGCYSRAVSLVQNRIPLLLKYNCYLIQFRQVV